MTSSNSRPLSNKTTFTRLWQAAQQVLAEVGFDDTPPADTHPHRVINGRGVLDFARVVRLRLVS